MRSNDLSVPDDDDSFLQCLSGKGDTSQAISVLREALALEPETKVHITFLLQSVTFFSFSFYEVCKLLRKIIQYISFHLLSTGPWLQGLMHIYWLL